MGLLRSELVKQRRIVARLDDDRTRLGGAPMPDAVLWDVDGTLVDTAEATAPAQLLTSTR